MQKPNHSATLMRRASICSVTVACTLIALKLGAWILTGSLSLLSSLIDSMLDVAASLITFFAVRYAIQPPDKEHRFGHGKAEDIAALAQSAFIAGSALFIAFEAVGRFLNPHPIEHGAIGIGVMLISLLLTSALLTYQRYVIAQTGSTAIHADAIHYLTDVLVNIAVIVTLFAASQPGWEFIDPLCALGIAAYISYSAWRIASRAFQNLMDREFSDNDRERITTIVLEHPDVKGIHMLKTRRSGHQAFIQFHMELDGSITLLKAHEIADAIHDRLHEAFPNVEIIIHEDPAEIEEPHRNEDDDRRVSI